MNHTCPSPINVLTESLFGPLSHACGGVHVLNRYARLNMCFHFMAMLGIIAT
jgi:hypothetical protein